jgi:hypothetical protein
MAALRSDGGGPPGKILRRRGEERARSRAGNLREDGDVRQGESHHRRSNQQHRRDEGRRHADRERVRGEGGGRVCDGGPAVIGIDEMDTAEAAIQVFLLPAPGAAL